MADTDKNGCVNDQAASAVITALQNIVTAINGITQILTSKPQ